jgi:hypothetical protein
LKTIGRALSPLLFTYLLVIPPPAGSAEPTGPAEPAAPENKAEKGAVQLVLADGSQISGTVALENIAMATQYGRLVVPLDQVLRLRVGRGSDPKTAAKVRALIAKLGSANFDERQKATESLIELGPAALEELRLAARHEDAEVRSRAEKALAEIDQGPEEAEEDGQEAPLYGGNDELVSRLFIAVGRIELDGLEVATRYGKLSVPRDQIVLVRFGKVEARSYAVEVSGSNTCRNMMATKVRVKPGDMVRISASGKIHFDNWGTEVGPEGNPENFGENNNAPGMCLVMRIGSEGTFRAVGTGQSFKADKSGDLFLGVNHSGNVGRTRGSWKVKVTLGSRG